VSVTVGAPATFSIVISGGTAPVTYQWKRNGAVISGATSASYTIPATVIGDNGATFVVDIINPAGTLSGAAASLTVTAPVVSPTIATQPANVSVIVGAPATFSVVISGGTAPVTYQWKRNGTAIAGATTTSYTIPATVTGDNGATFTVDIINPVGTLNSASAILTVTPAGPGVNFTVDTIDDRIDDDIKDGECRTSVNTCSLRAAIMQANHLTVPLTRINVPAGTYTLKRPPTGDDNDETSGDLNLTTPTISGQTVVIVGAGAASTVIDANQIDRIIQISDGRIATLEGFTLRNGLPNEVVGKNGGGIRNRGSLTIIECVIERNQSVDGGGIFSDGTLKVTRSTIRSNSGVVGGGLFLFGPTTVRDSAVIGNHARDGGGIHNLRSLYLVDSTLSQNTADGDGGGIKNNGTYTDVSTNMNPKGVALAALFNATIVDNDADHDRDMNGGIGGGVFNQVGSHFIAYNTLIARNTLVDSPIYNDCNGNLELYGVDLLSELSGCIFSGSSTVGLISLSAVDPALKDNGGPTFTYALLPGNGGNPAIDTTTAEGCVDETGAVLATDQRGAPRVAGSRCDVGAYEYLSVVP